MGDVSPRFKSEIACACGCGRVGPPRRKPWRDGLHTRDCDCVRCRSRDYGRGERRRVRRFARRSGLTASARSGAFNGRDLYGVLLVEETAARAIVEPIERWWARKDVQEKVAQVADQSLAPWGLALSWDDRVQLVLMPAAAVEELCQAAAGPDYGKPPS